MEKAVLYMMSSMMLIAIREWAPESKDGRSEAAVAQYFNQIVLHGLTCNSCFVPKRAVISFALSR